MSIPNIFSPPGLPSSILQTADGSSGGAAASINIASPAVAVVLALNSPTLQFLAPTASVPVTFPSSATCPGRAFLIRNRATTGNFTLTLTQHAADGGGVLATLAPGEELWSVSTGVAATGFVTAQSDPTSHNVNVEAIAGDITLGATAARSRQYQVLTPDATNRVVNLPLSDTQPGRGFWIRNAGNLGGALVVTPDAGDPPGTTTLLPGQEGLFISSPTAGFIVSALNLGPEIRAAAPGVDVVLTAASAEVQVLAPTASINVDLPDPTTVAGRRFTIRHTGLNPAFALTIRTSAPATLLILTTGDQATFICSASGDNFRLADYTRGFAARAQAMAGDLVLGLDVVADPLAAAPLQLLNPNANRNVDLPAVTGRELKASYTIVNTSDSGGGALEVITVRGLAANVVAVLLPGDRGTFVPDTSLPANWRQAPGRDLRGFEAMGAIPAGPTATRAKHNTATYGAGGAGADSSITLPAEAAFAGQTLFFDVTGAAVAGDDVLLRNSLNTITVATVLGAAGPPRVGFILVSDGLAWQVALRWNLP